MSPPPCKVGVVSLPPPSYYPSLIRWCGRLKQVQVFNIILMILLWQYLISKTGFISCHCVGCLLRRFLLSSTLQTNHTPSPVPHPQWRCVLIISRASLRFEKILNFPINPQKLSIFCQYFSNRSIALIILYPTLTPQPLSKKRPGRKLSLRQTRDAIAEIYASKEVADQRAREQGLPRWVA